MGLVLVLGATVLGGVVVGAADDTVPMLAARQPLVRGDVIGGDDLAVVRVRLGDLQGGYLAAADPVAADAVALRDVAVGELVPRAAVGAGADLDVRPLAVPWRGPRPAALVRGASVDLWVAPREGATELGEPRQVVAGAEVAAVDEGGAGLGGATGTQVQVMLEPDEVRTVLTALAADDRVDLVLVPGPRS